MGRIRPGGPSGCKPVGREPALARMVFGEYTPPLTSPKRFVMAPGSSSRAISSQVRYNLETKSATAGETKQPLGGVPYD